MVWEKWADVSFQRLSAVLRQTLALGALLMMLFGMLACQADPRSPEIAPEILLSQLDNQEAPLVLDVRSEAEFNKGHIPGAIHISHREFPNRLEELAAFKAQPVILYCEAGMRAGIAETTLVGAGFQQVIHLAGDMQEWRRRGFPVESRPAIP